MLASRVLTAWVDSSPVAGDVTLKCYLKFGNQTFESV